MKQTLIKRIVSITLASAMCLSAVLTGCSTGGSSKGSGSTAAASETVSATKAATDANADSGKYPSGSSLPHYTIGIVIHSTQDFLTSHLKDYLDYLGKSYNVDFKFDVIENFSDDTYLNAIENLCSQGVNGVICTNFSGTAIMKGISICQSHKVYMGVGFSQVTDSSIRDAAINNKYYVGSAYENDFKAGYDIVRTLADKGCKNIAAMGYTPGLTSHDRRWSGMMQAFKDNPNIKKVGEYKGTNWTPALQNFLATNSDMDGVAITLLGMELCSQPIKAAGKEGKVKIGCLDFSDKSLEGLKSGELAITVGGQFVDILFPFLLMYNKLAGTPLSDKAEEIQVPMVECTTAQQFEDYMKYVNGDIWPWTADETKAFVKKFNPNAKIGDLVDAAASYSTANVKQRHAQWFK